RYPDDPRWVRDVAVGFDKIGNLKLRGGETPAAIAYYQRALASIRELLQRDAANVGWQRDAAVTLNKIADAKVAAGNLSEAIAAYDGARTIAAGLVQRDPNNA